MNRSLAILLLALLPDLCLQATSRPQPNIVFCMADDMGWGDTGYNGHPVLKTPYLDQMARDGAQFNRFYAAAPVCSPTRGSCLTGRHPFRYGIYYANTGHMKKQEITLAEALQPLGYATGHFGKWHLGTLTTDRRDGRRGGRQNQHYSPPWENGFDTCFATEQAVPTWNPTQNQKIPTSYWTGPGQIATNNLDGDDSRVIMDRALPFIRSAVQSDKPFLAVIWFHTPHSPVIAGPEYRTMYPGQDENHQHYYGCITAMDDQIGRLRGELNRLGAAENTMLWFASDNGPAAKGGGPGKNPGARQQGTTGPFRARKGSLYEGGVRVPGLLVWPAKIKEHKKFEFPSVTSDYFPTVLAVLGHHLNEQDRRPYDGLNLLPFLQGQHTTRPHPIAFQSRRQQALSDNRWKLYSNNAGKTWELYDLIADPGETKSLAADRPDLVRQMASSLQTWIASCKGSDQEHDYRPISSR